MGDVPVLKPREVAAILTGLGFVQVRQRGSHCQYRHPDGRVTITAGFRGKFLAGLTRLFDDGRLSPGPHAHKLVTDLVEPAAFARLKHHLYQKDWVVYAKAPFRKPDALFRYLGLYTHRVAISNHRLLRVDNDQIVFRTRDHRVCTLAPLEFMRRFLQHLLPRGFVKIRHSGLHAASNVNSRLAIARACIEASRRPLNPDTPPPPPTLPKKTDALDWRALFKNLTGTDLGVCPDCGGPINEGPPSTVAAPRERHRPTCHDLQAGLHS